jgi:hypothetical protein
MVWKMLGAEARANVRPPGLNGPLNCADCPDPQASLFHMWQMRTEAGPPLYVAYKVPGKPPPAFLDMYR